MQATNGRLQTDTGPSRLIQNKISLTGGSRPVPVLQADSLNGNHVAVSGRSRAGLWSETFQRPIRDIHIRDLQIDLILDVRDLT